MRCIYTLLLAVFISTTLLGQDASIDSLMLDYKHSKTLKEIARAEIELTNHYSYRNIDSVRKYGFSALDKAYQLKNEYLISECYHMLINGYGFKQITQITDTVWTLIDSAEHYANKLNDYKRLIKICNAKGVVSFSQNNYENSINYYLQAEQLAKKHNDSLQIATIKLNISNCFMHVNKEETAIDYIKQAKHVFKKINANTNVLFSINNLASVYLIKKDTVNLIACFDEFYRESVTTDNILFKIKRYGFMGFKYKILKQADSAEFYYRKAIDMAEQVDKPFYARQEYESLAVLFNTRNVLDSAEYYFKEALAFYENSYVFKELEILENLSNLYKKQSKYEASLLYLTKYKELYDSVKISSITSIVDKALNEQELNYRLTEINRLINNYDKKSRLILWVLSFLSVLLFISVWHYHNNSIQNFYKKSSHSQINDQESFWNFSFPNFTIKSTTIASFSLGYGLFNAIFLIVFTNKQPENYLWIIYYSVSLAFLVFIISKAIIDYKKPKTRTFLQDLRFYAIWFICLLAISALMNYGLLNIEPDWTTKGTMLPTILVSIFVLFIAFSFFNYNKRHEWLRQYFFMQFKKLLEEKQVQSAQQNISPTRKQLVNIEGIETDTRNLVYIVSDNIYQEIISEKNGEIYKQLARCTLSQVEDILQPYPQFLRCHRSHIVNTNYIKTIEGNSRQQFFKLKITDVKIPVSRTLNNQIMEHFNNMVG